MRTPASDDLPDGDEFEFERPSKTRLKQQAHDLQALGEELATLPASRLEPLNLPEPLLQALADYRRIKSHEGLRRQRQYLGKQMRLVDAGPLREAVDAYKLGSASETLALHEAERWRDELVASDDALTRWAAEHPGSDVQQLRNLVRQVRRDAQPDKQSVSHGTAPRRGRAYRELFQQIRVGLKTAGQAPLDDDVFPEPDQ